MKKIILCFFILFVSWQIEAQIQVGYGSTNVLTSPISSCYSYSYTQQIYLGSEIGVPGTITQLSFYFKLPPANGSTTNSTGWTIYMGNTTKTEFAGTTDWESFSNLSPVFTGDVVFPTEQGWMTIVLDTPFVYNGTSNLLIGVDENTPSANCTINFNGYDVGSNRSIYYRSNSVNPSSEDPPLAVSTSASVANVVFGGLVPTQSPSCTSLINPINGAESISSSQITWEAAMGSPTGYKLKVGTTTGGNEVINNIDVGNVLTYDIGSLLPGTTYYVTVSSYNSIGESTNCSESSFTSCGPNTEFYENFDSSPTGSTAVFTPCWGKAGNGNVYINTGSNAPATFPNQLFMSANVDATIPTVAYAITPSISNLQAQTHQLKFKAFATTLNKTLDIGYMTDLSDVSTFVMLDGFSLPGTNVASTLIFSIAPQNIPAGVTNLVFRNPGTEGATSIYIDDVTWELIPACNDISSVSLESYTSSTAHIIWEEGGEEEAWQYVYAESSVEDPSTLISTIVDVTMGSELNLANLNPSTSYKVWIRSNCGNGAVGNWPQEPFVFTTACAPVSQFFENFDDYATGSTNPLPDCWSKAGTTGYSYLLSGSADPASAPNRLYLSSNEVNATTAIAILPPVSNLQAETHRLRFKAFCNNPNKSIEIGYFEIPNNPTTFVLLESLDLNATTQATIEEIVYIPQSVPQGVESLVFRNKGDLYPGTTVVYIDDVFWENIPACADVVINEITDLTSTSVQFNWDPGEGITDWQYVYAESDIIDPASLTPIDVEANPTVNLNILSPATTYNYWIRSNCGNGDFGNWSAMQTFMTKCAPAENFYENFDSSPIGSSSPMPNCWEKAGNGSINVTSGGVDPGSPPNRLYMFANGSGVNPTKAYAIMPPVSNLQLDTHRLKFKAYCSTNEKFLEVGYFLNMDDIETFVTLETFALPGTTAASAEEFVYESTNIPEGVTSLVLRNVGIPTGSAAIYIDDVIWEYNPNCADITEMFLNEVSPITASFSWNAGGDETAWQYVYAEANVDNPSTLVPTLVSTTPSVIIDELTPITTYKIWVRSVCGSDDYGVWSNPLEFTTDCMPYNSFPWQEGFESIETVGTNAFPTCWTKENGDWSSSIVNNYVEPRTGMKFLRNSSNALDEYIWTWGFELTAGVSYDFSFFVLGDGAAAWSANVFVNNIANSLGATQLGITFNIPGEGNSASTADNEYNSVKNTFTPTVTGAYYFGIQLNQASSLPYYVGFDDFKLDLTPSCASPNSLSVSNITATSAIVNWNASVSNPANGYEYFYSNDGTVPTSLTTALGNVAAGTTQAVLNELTPSSEYKIWVRSICGMDEISNWSDAMSFETPCTSLIPPFLEDFTTFLPDCWATASQGDLVSGPTINNTGFWITDGFLNEGISGSAKVNIYAANRTSWLISPMLDLSAGGEYTLTFDYGITASYSTTAMGMGSDDTVQVVMTEDGGITWTQIQLYDAYDVISNLGEEFSYTFTSNSAFVRFAIIANDGTANNPEDYNFYVDNLTVESTLGNSSFENNSFVAYPNPVIDILNINYSYENATLSVFNILGQQVMTSILNTNNKQINMSHLSAGTYLVKIVTETESKTIKVIKK